VHALPYDYDVRLDNPKDRIQRVEDAFLILREFSPSEGNFAARSIIFQARGDADKARALAEHSRWDFIARTTTDDDERLVSFVASFPACS